MTHEPADAARPAARRRSTGRRAVAWSALAGAGLALAVLPGDAAALPTPPRPAGLPSAVEVLQPYVGQRGCDPVAKPGVRAFSGLLMSTYRDTGSLGIVRDCGTGGQSEHKEGRAFDWRVSVHDAHQVAEVKAVTTWLTASRSGQSAAYARRFGIMYMIWDHRIWKSYQAARGWQRYTGPNPHTDHVHFSFGWAGARRHTSWWTGRVAKVEYGPYASEPAPVPVPALPPAPEPVPRPAPKPVPKPVPKPAPAPSPAVRLLTASSPRAGVVDVADAGSRGDARLRQVVGGRVGAVRSLGGRIAGAPAVVSRDPASLTVFASTAAGGLYLDERRADGTFGGFRRLPGVVSSRPAVTARDGRVDLVVRDADGRLLHRWSPAPGTWSPWESLGGAVLPGTAPGLAWTRSGRLCAVVVGTDGQVWQRTSVPGGGWTPWQSLGGQVASDVSAAPLGGDRVLVAVRGRDGAGWVREAGLRESGRDRHGHGRGGWSSLGGRLASAPGAVVAPGSTDVTLLAAGRDGRLYRSTRTDRGATGWARLG